jgi:hypothetical protein
MNRVRERLEDLGSIVIAVLRLMFLTCTMFISGLQIVLFSGLEICNVELKGRPWRSRIERNEANMAFLDRLCIENPELLDIPEGELPDDFPHPNDEDSEDF